MNARLEGGTAGDLITCRPFDAALALYDLWLGATLMTKLRHDTHAFKNALLATRQMLQIH